MKEVDWAVEQFQESNLKALVRRTLAPVPAQGCRLGNSCPGRGCAGRGQGVLPTTVADRAELIGETYGLVDVSVNKEKREKMMFFNCS